MLWMRLGTLRVLPWDLVADHAPCSQTRYDGGRRLAVIMSKARGSVMRAGGARLEPDRLELRGALPSGREAIYLGNTCVLPGINWVAAHTACIGPRGASNGSRRARPPRDRPAPAPAIGAHWRCPAPGPPPR